MNNENGLIITNKNTEGTEPRSNITAIKEARADAVKQNSILNSKIASINQDQDYYKIVDSLVSNFNHLNKVIEEQIKNGDEAAKQSAQQAKALLAQTNATKDLEKMATKYHQSLQELDRINKDGAVSSKKLFEVIDSFESISDTAPALASLFNNIEKHIDNVDDSFRELEKSIYANAKAQRDEASAARKAAEDKYNEKVKTGGQSLEKEYAKEWKNIGNSLKDLLNTFNLDRIAQQFAPNARQKLQQDIQTNFSLNKKEFQNFKQDLFNQVDNQIYSSEEIMNAMSTLTSTAVGNTETATKYFQDLVRGQKFLGLSSQTQETLLRLGNITGRNELKFYTTQVAKYLNSDLNLNKKQLDELTSLNANLATQAADIGISSTEFRTMSANEQAAFEATNAGYGSKYTQAMSSLLANTDTTAALLGMDSGQLSQRLASGESLVSMLRNGAGSRAALNVLSSGDEAAITRYYEHAKAAWGIDENTWSILRVIAQQEKDLNKNLKTATDASKQNDKVLEKTEKRYGDSLTLFQKFANQVDNWWNGSQDWELLNYVEDISKTVKLIWATMTVKDIFGSIGNMLGKGGGSSAISSVLAKMGITGSGGTALGSGTALLSAGSLLAGIAGLGFGLSDAITNARDQSVKVGWTGNSTVDGLLSTGLSYERGMLMGNTYKGNENNFEAGAGNTLKWAGIGAGIGTLIAPGVGTLAGGAIGAAIGAVGSLIGSELEKNTDATKEQADDLADIKKNTYETAMNTYKQGIGVVYRYRGTSNYSSASGAMGAVSYSGGIGDISYPVSSRYGYRGSFTTTNGKKTNPFHSGTDYAAPKGTPLYSNVTGTVLAAGRDSSGANYVGVTDANGYTHWYWHMNKPATVSAGQKVQAGQLVGYVGATGNVTGPHLHYTVTKPGAKYPSVSPKNNTVDSLPFATKNIFNGSGTITTESSDSGVGIDLSNAFRTSATKIDTSKLGDLAGPIVGSIGDLKNTIIKLSEQTSRNQKIMDALVNRTMQSPTI